MMELLGNTSSCVPWGSRTWGSRNCLLKDWLGTTKGAEKCRKRKFCPCNSSWQLCCYLVHGHWSQKFFQKYAAARWSKVIICSKLIKLKSVQCVLLSYPYTTVLFVCFCVCVCVCAKSTIVCHHEDSLKFEYNPYCTFWLLCEKCDHLSAMDDLNPNWWPGSRQVWYWNLGLRDRSIRLCLDKMVNLMLNQVKANILLKWCKLSNDSHIYIYNLFVYFYLGKGNFSQ